MKQELLSPKIWTRLRRMKNICNRALSRSLMRVLTLETPQSKKKHLPDQSCLSSPQSKTFAHTSKDRKFIILMTTQSHPLHIKTHLETIPCSRHCSTQKPENTPFLDSYRQESQRRPKGKTWLFRTKWTLPTKLWVLKPTKNTGKQAQPTCSEVIQWAQSTFTTKRIPKIR